VVIQDKLQMLDNSLDCEEDLDSMQVTWTSAICSPPFTIHSPSERKKNGKETLYYLLITKSCNMGPRTVFIGHPDLAKRSKTLCTILNLKVPLAFGLGFFDWLNIWVWVSLIG